MACTQVRVSGLSEFLKLTEEKFKGKTVFSLFTGTPDPLTGNSWCPDCVTADPVIQACIPDIPSDAVFITCFVGDRSTWKDPHCEFRVHPKTLLKSVPTLMKFSTPERLTESQCADKDLVQMLFTSD